jgi:glucose/arabinose dehydrogenase
LCDQTLEARFSHRKREEVAMYSWLRPAALLMALLPVLTAAQARSEGVTRNAQDTLQIERLATLEFPWGMALLPDNRLLITEKPGRVRIYTNGKLSLPLEGVPAVAYQEGPAEQGGMLDVAVDPDFSQNRRVFLSYTEEASQPTSERDQGDARFGEYLDLKDNRLRGGVVASATLDGNRLSNVQVIWRQVPKTIGRGHFGHRLIFGRDGTLFVTSGERMRFDPAQDLATNLGKVVRINRDGSIPKDNPFTGKVGARSDIYSLGHRNILAAAVNPSSGRLWAFEMGPLGGDELNVIQPGRNYGWPVVSDGVNYDKSPIPDHRTRPEFEEPIRTWTPVISPSGAIFYDGTLFPWKGHAIVGGLSSKALIRLETDGTRVVREERLDMQRRIRDVVQAADGALLVITDDKNGELLRLTPKGEEKK